MKDRYYNVNIEENTIELQHISARVQVSIYEFKMPTILHYLSVCKLKFVREKVWLEL